MFVFAGVIFSGQLLNPYALGQSITAFVFFCMASGLIYIINDLQDIEQDRLHPTKRNRPLPAGLVSQKEARIVAIFLSIAVLLSFLWEPYVGAIIWAYIIINILYAYIIKHLVIIDIISISLGFVFRVMAGSLAVRVVPSPWMLLCTLFLAIFLALGKRSNELDVLKENAGEHRKNLNLYNKELINQWSSIATSMTILTYSLYTFIEYSNLWMMLTIPFTIYGLFRYQYLVAVKKLGGSPEQILSKDRPFLINALMWIVISISILYI